MLAFATERSSSRERGKAKRNAAATCNNHFFLSISGHFVPLQVKPSLSSLNPSAQEQV